jgi:hypothetical protein
MDWLQGEPTLKEVLSDPVVLALMARDKVDRASLNALARKVSRRPGGSSAAKPQPRRDDAA